MLLVFVSCALGQLLVGCAVVAAQSPAVKNVLLVIADDLRADALACYGDRFCQAPNIDALAERGLVFNRAYCQGTSCGPSRRSFMFSRYAITEHETRAGGVNLGQHFRKSGWYTARVGKIFHMRVPGDIIAGTDGQDHASAWTERFNSPGLEAHTPGDYACLNLNIFTDSLENRQSTAMPHRSFVTVQYDGDGSDQPDHKSASQAIELLQQHKQEPFFLAVGFIRPHYPMVAPREYFAAYPWQQMQLPAQRENDLDDIPKPGWARTNSATNPIGKYPDNQQRMWAGYYASITFMDRQLGRILNELDRLGLRDSTAVVFTSDHGYHLGDHGFWQKSNLHEQILRVPLIVSLPRFSQTLHPQGSGAGWRTDSLVELTDLYPTLAELAGLNVPTEVQGRSFSKLFADPQHRVRESALSVGDGYSLRTADWHYIRYNPREAELYDMNADPNQFDNLVADPAYRSIVANLDALLQSRLSDAGLR